MKILEFTSRLWPDWIRCITHRVSDPRIQSRCLYSIEQVVFSGLMVFILRYRSLHSFCLENRGNEVTLKNFGRWISISEIPSDDDLRYCLQTVPTAGLNLLLKDIHQQIERKKILAKEKLFNRYELISLDGTGHLDSKHINCESCLEKTLQTGEVHFYHGQLLASLISPSASYSLPFQFEPIQRADTQTQYSKNDCELNAAKRLLAKLRTHFPKRSFCFLGDNLLAVYPIVEIIEGFNWRYLITAKPEKNKEVFFMFDYLHEQRQEFEAVDQKGVRRIYRWSNGLPLKQFKKDEKPILVNLLEYEEIDSNGISLYKSSWITNFEITKDNISVLARSARARFAIENRNFNEQKNLGFQTEHNFGHAGNLPNVFFGLAQLAQLITELFSFWKTGKLAIQTVGSKRRYFERLAVVVGEALIPDDGVPIFYLKFDFSSA